LDVQRRADWHRADDLPCERRSTRDLRFEMIAQVLEPLDVTLFVA